MPSAIARRGLALAGVVVVLDQATKWAMVSWLGEVGAVVPVTSFFNLVYALNRGASFGMFSSASEWGPWLLSGFAVVVVAALVVWLLRADEAPFGLALGLIIGGAVGNLCDRLYRGAVVDFIDLHAGGMHWPAFNVADSAITVGVAVILYASLIGASSGRRVAGRKDT